MKNLLLAAFLCTFIACKDGDKVNENTETKKTETPVSSNIKNGITIKENGLKVEKAMLLSADGTALSDDNKVGLGEDVLCRLFISGWKVEDGKVKLGASQIIETNEGDVILEEKDLFSSIESASAEDAGVITLKATITQLQKSVREFVVKFKVWDKVSNADVSGEFHFNLK